MSAAALQMSAKQFTVVIDAGHGGDDLGAQGAYSREKDINLKVALAFGRYIEQYMPNVRTLYTRKSDVFIPLIDRANMANKNRADLFISIHTNAVPKSKTVFGIETYTMGLRRSDEKFSAALRENEVITYEKDYMEKYDGYDPNSPESLIMFELMHDNNMFESVELASSMQKNLCAESGRQDKGVKQDVFLVLRETSMPACLVELGFISTPEEEDFLNTDEGLNLLAYGLYKGLAQYTKQELIVEKPLSAGKDSKAKQEPSAKPKQEPSAKPETPKTAPIPPAKAAPSKEIASKSNDAKKDSSKGNDAKKDSSKGNDAKKDSSKGNDAKGNASKDKDAKGNASKDKDAKANADKKQQKSVEIERPEYDPKAKSIYKVQILSSPVKLRAGDAQLKGHKDAKYYKEGGSYKYTIGESSSKQEAYNLRVSLLQDFPQAFVITVQNGVRVK